jgi:hypothetical protein
MAYIDCPKCEHDMSIRLTIEEIERLQETGGIGHDFDNAIAAAQRRKIGEWLGKQPGMTFSRDWDYGPWKGHKQRDVVLYFSKAEFAALMRQLK